MPEETVQPVTPNPAPAPTPPPKKGFRIPGLIVVIFLAGLICFGGYVAWLMFGFMLPWEENGVPDEINSKTATSTATTTDTSKNADSQIIGVWESECLIPDPESKWAEKHQFTLESEGTAVHIRWSNDTVTRDCDQPTTTLTNKYTYEIPSAGQIDLHDTEEGVDTYDIYKISGNTLLFGHGFRNNVPYPSTHGTSSADRLNSLNTYIEYKKK